MFSEDMMISSEPSSTITKVRGYCALCTAHCCEHGWWQACKELKLPGYDTYGDDGANSSVLIGTDLADPVSGSLPHRSYLCRIRPAE